MQDIMDTWALWSSTKIIAADPKVIEFPVYTLENSEEEYETCDEHSYPPFQMSIFFT